jgi:hypothetical protein
VLPRPPTRTGARVRRSTRWHPQRQRAARGAPQLESLTRISELTTYVGLPLTLTFVALVGALFGGRSDYDRKLQRCLLAVLVQLALATLAFVMLNPDWMNEFRFATPVWALASFAIGLGLVGFTADGARSPISRAVFCGALVVAAVITRPTMTARRALFARWPTVSLCQVADEYRLYNLYGDLLDIKKGHLVLPDLGGSSLVSRYTLIDNAGLTDKVVAQKLKQRDAAGLQRYILEEVRPVFLHKHGIYLPDIASDPRFAEYEAIVDRRDYVRRDALKNPPDLDRLTALRAKAPSMITAVQSVYEQDARRSCGDRLVPGSLPSRDVLPDAMAAQ